MALLILKYGGSSLADPQQIKAVANRVGDYRKRGYQVIVVVSAMGKTTDQLVALAHQVSAEPSRRELDMLLSTGERISMALMSMALHDLGISAISFTGSQAGLFTDESHANARIVDVKPTRVETELSRGNIVVLAGFQGVSPKTKEVTTLGRGGSDTSAVAMAAHFRAERCEIRKDVDGVRTADPKLVPRTQHLRELSYQQLLDMTFWGAKVLHYRSAELAAVLQIPLVIGLAHDGQESVNQQTLVHGGAKMFEQDRVIAVNSHAQVRKLTCAHAFAAGNPRNLLASLSQITDVIEKAGLPLPQILASESGDALDSFLISAPTENLLAIERLLTKPTPSASKTPHLAMSPEQLASVTVTCQGSYASRLAVDLSQALERAHIRAEKILFGPMSLTYIIPSKDREAAIQTLHSFIPNAHSN